MTNQPKPAPTAEEQPLELPPLELTQEERTKAEGMAKAIMESGSPIDCIESYVLHVYARERQLLAALRSNREKDAQLANFEDVLESMKELDKSRNPCGHLACYGFTDNGGKTGFCTLCELAENDAKIAELTQRIETLTELDKASEEQRDWLVTKKTEAEAQLRALSEALKGKFEIEFGEDFVPRYRTFHVDAVFDDLRSIVDGKD